MGSLIRNRVFIKIKESNIITKYKLSIMFCGSMIILILDYNWIYFTYWNDMKQYQLVDCLIADIHDNETVVCSMDGKNVYYNIQKEATDKIGEQVKLLIFIPTSYVQGRSKKFEIDVIIIAAIWIGNMILFEKDTSCRDYRLRDKYYNARPKKGRRLPPYDVFKWILPFLLLLYIPRMNRYLYKLIYITYIILAAAFIAFSDYYKNKRDFFQSAKRTKHIQAKIFDITTQFFANYYYVHCSYKSEEGTVYTFVSKGVPYIYKNDFDMEIDIKEFREKNKQLKEEVKKHLPAIQKGEYIEVLVEPSNYSNYYVVIDNLF